MSDCEKMHEIVWLIVESVVFRDFAEAIFEKEKREVAALDSGGWNVGNVVEPRRRCATHFILQSL